MHFLISAATRGGRSGGGGRGAHLGYVLRHGQRGFDVRALPRVRLGRARDRALARVRARGARGGVVAVVGLVLLAHLIPRNARRGRSLLPAQTEAHPAHGRHQSRAASQTRERTHVHAPVLVPARRAVRARVPRVRAPTRGDGSRGPRGGRRLPGDGARANRAADLASRRRTRPRRGRREREREAARRGHPRGRVGASAGRQCARATIGSALLQCRFRARESAVAGG